MIVKHIVFFGCLAFAVISCDKIGNKNNRSSGGEEAAATETPAEDADATAAEGETAQDPAGVKVDPAMALAGKDLYAKLCATCHQDLAKSDIGKTPLAKLRDAVATVPDMAGLKDTSDKDLEAITAALSDIAPGKGKGKKDAELEAEDE
jgi:hypothetical protein